MTESCSESQKRKALQRLEICAGTWECGITVGGTGWLLASTAFGRPKKMAVQFDLKSSKAVEGPGWRLCHSLTSGMGTMFPSGLCGLSSSSWVAGDCVGLEQLRMLGIQRTGEG